MASARLTTVDISTAKAPATDGTFSTLSTPAYIGPEPVLSPDQTLATNAVQPTAPVNVAVWTVMDKFDDGLKKALMNFIDTTKEGVKIPQDFKGRTKVMDFYFVGTSSQSVAPAEIGAFSFEMSYPPGGNTISNAPVSTSGVVSINTNGGLTLG
jgi:hypothetical protein